jgi:hypothetical protein
MASAGVWVGLAIALLVTGGLFLITWSQYPCSSFPLCSVSTPALWGGVGFLGLAAVCAAIRAFGRRGRVMEPLPTD